MKREATVDLFRCLMMLGICLMHAVGQGFDASAKLSCRLMPCVVGFVVISGWFGVRFSPSRVLRLVGCAVWCAVVQGLLVGDVSRAGEILKSYWFVWGYLFLMMVAPLVDAAVEAVRHGNASDRHVLVPVVLCVFGWGLLAGNHVTGSWIPWEPVLLHNSGVTLLAVYAVVRFLKVCRTFGTLSTISLWGTVGISLSFVLVGFYSYNSPFALALALAAFVLFTRRAVDGGLARVVRWLAPSMFAVYLYHTGPFFDVIWSCERMLVEDVRIPIAASWGLVALAVFVGCVFIDIPRRVLVRLLRPVSERVLNGLDECYGRLLGEKR